MRAGRQVRARREGGATGVWQASMAQSLQGELSRRKGKEVTPQMMAVAVPSDVEDLLGLGSGDPEDGETELA